MIKIFIIIFSIYFAPSVFSAESAPCGDYGECDDYSYDLYNNESLQKGLATYINYCYGCHSLKYSRWGRIAADLEIPEEILFENLIFYNLKYQVFWYFFCLNLVIFWIRV